MSEVEKQRLQVLYEEEKKKYKAKMDKVLTYLVFDFSHRKYLISCQRRLSEKLKKRRKKKASTENPPQPQAT